MGIGRANSHSDAAFGLGEAYTVDLNALFAPPGCVLNQFVDEGTSCAG